MIPTEELQRLHEQACRRLHAAEIEEQAIVRRWTEVHCNRAELSLSIQRMEKMLLERRQTD